MSPDPAAGDPSGSTGASGSSALPARSGGSGTSSSNNSSAASAAAAAAAAAAGGGAAAALVPAAVAAARRRGAAPLPVGPLLRFGDAAVEAAFRAYVAPAAVAGDRASLPLTAALALAALAHGHASGAWGLRAPARAGPLLAAAAAAAEPAALLLLLRRRPAAYAARRDALVAGARALRVALWLLCIQPHLRLAAPSHHLVLRAFLLSPAATSLWFALFFPLPLGLHLALLLGTALAAAAAGPPLAAQLLAAPGVPEAVGAAHARLGRMARYLDAPAHRLAPRAGGRPLSPADMAWCVHAFAALCAGLVLPLLALFAREAGLRAQFLSRLAPLLPPAQAAATRRALYGAALTACFVLLSCVPALWGVLQLVPRFCLEDGGASGGSADGADGASSGGGVRLWQLRPRGAALVLTVLGVEAFMRAWLLAVVR